MIVFPNAKINIGLNVVEKRKDGYHNIASCFYPIPLTDALEVVEAESFGFQSTGIFVPGDKNIVVQAYDLLKDAYSLPPVAIHLHKHIPIGAGLGGGSADAAFMINLLNDMFNLDISLADRIVLASQLGSDCPFFIENTVKYVEGTGNIFSAIDLDLSGYALVLVYPDIQISTKEAYDGLKPGHPEQNLQETLATLAVSSWKEAVFNDFERTTKPEVLKIKDNLYATGAVYASMSGSGSAVYGIFKKMPDITSIPGTKFSFQL